MKTKQNNVLKLAGETRQIKKFGSEKKRKITNIHLDYLTQFISAEN